jgi:hypothetical protein
MNAIKEQNWDSHIFVLKKIWRFKIIDRVNILKIENNGGQDE